MNNRRSVLSKLAALLGLSAWSAQSAQIMKGVAPDNESPMMALGYLSRILPSNYVFMPSPMKLAKDITSYVDQIKDESERRETSLAGVTTAAHGATGALNTAQRDDWAWHPAYQDTLNLRRKFDAALRMLAERIPPRQQIMFYACGCAALGNLPDGEMLPLQCGREGHETGAASIVRAIYPRVYSTPRPTIEELESILAQDGIGPAVIVLPNGQVTV